MPCSELSGVYLKNIQESTFYLDTSEYLKQTWDLKKNNNDLLFKFYYFNKLLLTDRESFFTFKIHFYCIIEDVLDSDYSASLCSSN